MTLPQVVKHFQARRIVVLHLRDHIVTFRPPPLHGVRLHTGRVFVDAPAGSTKPAGLVRLELESVPRASKEVGRTLFLRVAQRLQAAFKEVAWRTEAPRRRWRWVCGKDGAVRLRVDLERHDAVSTRAAGGTYQVRVRWRYAPNAPKPGPPKHTRFSPLRGATPAAVRRMVLRAGARWQDHARVYDLSFLPNGRVVVLGGSGAPESYAGTWTVIGGASPEVELRLHQDGFYARRHRYRAGRCRIDGQEPVPCLAGIQPPQLPYWYDR